MSLLIKNGTFWGEFKFGNKRHRFDLGVEVCGERPRHLRLPGDPAFERSRARAGVEFEKVKEEFTNPKKNADRLLRVHELVTGATVFAIRPGELLDAWRNARRYKSELSAQHIKNVSTDVGRFTRFLGVKYPKVTDFLLVTPAMASEFMVSVEATGVSNKTYNNTLGSLRAVFEAAGTKAGVPHNPFAGIPRKENRTVYRQPWSQDEVIKLVEAAKTEPLVGPIIVTAACTGMRRENCVRLRWSDVNLEAGTLNLEALKTKERLLIPILAPLREVLERFPHASDYCFPDSIKMFEDNPDGLNWRLKKLVKELEFTVSEAQPKGQRLRKPSSIGFHRFKTTFVSLALDAGVPVEMLRKIVGNVAVQTMLKHYYHPDKDAIREALENRLPEFFTGRVKYDVVSELKVAISALSGANAQNWENRVGTAKEHLSEMLKRFELKGRSAG